MTAAPEFLTAAKASLSEHNKYGVFYFTSPVLCHLQRLYNPAYIKTLPLSRYLLSLQFVPVHI